MKKKNCTRFDIRNIIDTKVYKRMKENIQGGVVAILNNIQKKMPLTFNVYCL